MIHTFTPTLLKTTSEDFRQYLELYSSIIPIDVDQFYTMGITWIRAHGSSGSSPEFSHLLSKWIESNCQDYSVYDHPYYVIDSWVCWKYYSNFAIRKLCIAQERNQLPTALWDGAKVLDVGAGIGYSSLALGELFPQAEVTATQIKDTHQYRFAQKLFQTHPRNKITTEDCLSTTDVLFASEYFEHFDHPLNHLSYLLDQTNPTFVIVKNTFAKPEAVGHFTHYYDLEGHPYPGNKMGTKFSRVMTKRGYRQSLIRFWNHTPTLWVHRRFTDLHF